MDAAFLKMTGACLVATAFVWGQVLGGWQSSAYPPAAVALALANRCPVLCLGNQHESLRAAPLVRPLAAPPPGQPSRT